MEKLREFFAWLRERLARLFRRRPAINAEQIRAKLENAGRRLHQEDVQHDTLQQQRETLQEVVADLAEIVSLLPQSEEGLQVLQDHMPEGVALELPQNLPPQNEEGLQVLQPKLPEDVALEIPQNLPPQNEERLQALQDVVADLAELIDQLPQNEVLETNLPEDVALELPQNIAPRAAQDPLSACLLGAIGAGKTEALNTLFADQNPARAVGHRANQVTTQAHELAGTLEIRNQGENGPEVGRMGVYDTPGFGELFNLQDNDIHRQLATLHEIWIMVYKGDITSCSEEVRFGLECGKEIIFVRTAADELERNFQRRGITDVQMGCEREKALDREAINWPDDLPFNCFFVDCYDNGRYDWFSFHDHIHERLQAHWQERRRGADDVIVNVPPEVPPEAIPPAPQIPPALEVGVA